MQKLTQEQKFKLPWEGFNAKERSDQNGTEITEPSLTQQSMTEQADINWIVHNFMPTALPQNVRIPMSGDFTELTDYREALHQIHEAENSFMQMPAELRSRLKNDPQQFIDYCADPKNLEEMRKLGLAVPAPKEPDKAPEPDGGKPA